MKILLTGASGYIGKRLLPVLVSQGFHVVCAVRDKAKFSVPNHLLSSVTVIQIDLLDAKSLLSIPKDIVGAFYLVHSMSSSSHYAELELRCASNFRQALNTTSISHVVFLSGIVNSKVLSDHLQSRLNVENELNKGNYNFTALRAGIIIGSGSASFEIIRDLVEKLPIMVTPRWLYTRCQPIGIGDVILFLTRSILNNDVFNKSYDIGGPDVLSYKDMLLLFAKVRHLKRHIYILPVMTPRLSSYWLYFVTSTSYKLAIALVDSMKVEVVCSKSSINNILQIEPNSYELSLEKAFTKIESNDVVSSWKDSSISSNFNQLVSEFVKVPTHGCFVDKRKSVFTNKEQTIEKIWSIGGDNGWYYGNRLWKLRGFIDKLFGGVGLRRGRTSSNSLHSGDVLDFWRVIYCNKKEGRLLLYAEMKLPGDAWLEFTIEGDKLIQTATFRPLGLKGRLYWFSVYPFHGLIFSGLLRELCI